VDVTLAATGLLNVMSKFMNLGMPLAEVIRATTWNPARCIGRKDLGHLGEGAVADVVLLSLRKGSFGFVDAWGSRITGGSKLECELTLRDGKVVYDLNGLCGIPLDASYKIQTENIANKRIEI
jgi:dihydroorotase